jgi:hypothetical protein
MPPFAPEFAAVRGAAAATAIRQKFSPLVILNYPLHANDRDTTVDHQTNARPVVAADRRPIYLQCYRKITSKYNTKHIYPICVDFDDAGR